MPEAALDENDIATKDCWVVVDVLETYSLLSHSIDEPADTTKTAILVNIRPTVRLREGLVTQGILFLPAGWHSIAIF